MTWHAWGLLLVLAPVLEEVVFRWGLQEALLARGLSARRAQGLTALAFAAAHLLLRGPSPWALATVVPAWCLGEVYTRWRRLAPCIALHALFNGVWGLFQILVMER